MGVRKFSAEDEEFREWVAKRPRGYVLNTDRGLSDRDSTREPGAEASCGAKELRAGCPDPSLQRREGHAPLSVNRDHKDAVLDPLDAPRADHAHDAERPVASPPSPAS